MCKWKDSKEYVGRDEAASPTAAIDSIIITSVIDAKEGRDIMTVDIPNAFVQIGVDPKNKEERIIIKIRGTLVDMLLELNYEKYSPFVVNEGWNKVLYVVMLKALYGMLQSALWFYTKFKNDIEQIYFVLNPYDPCMTNRMVNGNEHTITWHVDDVKSSHVDKKVNDDFLHWLKAMYASDCIGELKVTRVLRHNYLAMTLDYTVPGTLKLDMTTYVVKMVEDLPAKIPGITKCPWNKNLFKDNKNAKQLSKEKAEIFIHL
jgi:hypothetical protein